MKKFGTIAIVGTGLIGGSLGLVLKRRRLCSRVIGISRTAESLATARRIRAIDSGSLDLRAIGDAELVVVCLPVGEILALAPRIVKNAGKKSLICDVGSTKEEIARTFGRLTRRFVGCHPMAGSEKRGVANAEAELFRGSVCIVTPSPASDKDAAARVNDFWKRICGTVAVMSPGEHDRIMALVSHLPHAVAFALVNSVPGRILTYSASGFRDTTRLAASDEKLWEDIFFSNRENVIASIDAFGKNLRSLRDAVRDRDPAALRKLLSSAKTARQRLEK
jgi:prephenate dehydrogenase